MRRVARASAAVYLCCAAQMAAAAGFPDRPVTLVVGYAAGGGSDIITRFVAKALAERWSQPVVVENRVGADGSIAADYVARAPANGYTLIMVTNSHTMPPIGYTLNYDPVRSFAPVSLADDKPMVLMVHPSLPVNSVRDLIALAKARPGELN
jgi:tripartite-type tricarboxylate transporter receptor subunit TctC